MTQIEKIRKVVESFMVGYLWLHLPLVVAVGLVLGGDVAVPAVGAFVLASFATVSWRAAPGSSGTRYTMAVALMGIVAILVYQFAGHPWQIDMHMYFFAAIAMVTAFCDWRTLVAAAGAVAVHHLVLNYAYPAAVFPDGASLARVVLHAVIVVLQTTVLGWVAWRLIQAFNQSEEAVAKAQAAEQEVSRASADRDQMREDNEQRRHGEMMGLAEVFQADVGRFVDGLSQSAIAIRASAQDLDRMVDDVSGKAANAAESAGEVTSNVETVAAAAEELSASVQEVNRFISESSVMARDAVAEVEQTNATVESLALAADRIGAVVNLIQDIASQTNLLALNATIEAARAGEAGKGFAVVANEVKSLANQTAKATEEIASNVASIQNVTGGAVAAIRDIGGLVGRIEQAVSTIASSATTQGAAIDEIARSAQRAAQVTEAVSHNIAGVSDIAGQLETMSSQRVTDASALADQAQGVSAHVEEFLANLRAS